MQPTGLHLLLGLAVSMAGSPSFAEPPPTSAERDAEDPYGYSERGKAAFDAGKFELAYELYKAAWVLKQTHDIAGNLAQAELKLGKKRDAAEHLAFTLAHFPPSVQSDRREALKKVLEELRGQLGTLRIYVQPKEARVTLDGVALSASQVGEVGEGNDRRGGEELFLDVGAHRVEVTLEGYTPQQRETLALAGSSGMIAVSLERAPAAPAKVEKVVEGKAPAKAAVPPPPPVQRPPRRGGPSTGIVVAGGVTAGAALVVGAVFTVLANERTSAAREKNGELVKAMGPGVCAQSGACDEVAGLLSDRVTFTNVAGWSFVGAGVVGVATVVYALAVRREPKAEVRAAPVVMAHGAGIAVGGVW